MSDLIPSNDRFPQNPYPDDEIDLKELFMVLWSGKWLISALTRPAAAISVLVALSLPNIYTASALLAPAESSGGGLSGLMKQSGGRLASLAGVSLPGGEEGPRAQLGMQLMKSRAFIGDFVERRDILPEFMAVESWDVGSNDNVFDPESYDSASKTWVRYVDYPMKPMPSLLEAHTGYGYIKKGSQKGIGFVVDKFVEKLSRQVAEDYVESGNYLWNNGMFLCKASRYLEELYELAIQLSYQSIPVIVISSKIGSK